MRFRSPNNELNSIQRFGSQYQFTGNERADVGSDSLPSGPFHWSGRQLLRHEEGPRVSLGEVRHQKKAVPYPSLVQRPEWPPPRGDWGPFCVCWIRGGGVQNVVSPPQGMPRFPPKNWQLFLDRTYSHSPVGDLKLGKWRHHIKPFFLFATVWPRLANVL